MATLTVGDESDRASDLSRPSVFRLNVGVGKETFRSRFGPGPAHPGEGEAPARFDLTAPDRILPHPVYGKMSWICVLNPGAATFETVRALLGEAYDMAVRRHARAAPAADA
jgi:hypothetical protein